MMYVLSDLCPFLVHLQSFNIMKLIQRYATTHSSGQSYFSPSSTIQDDALTIREILTRFTNGQPTPDLEREVSYPATEPDIDSDTIDIGSADIADVYNASLNSALRARQMLDADNLSAKEAKTPSAATEQANQSDE